MVTYSRDGRQMDWMADITHYVHGCCEAKSTGTVLKQPQSEPGHKRNVEKKGNAQHWNIHHWR